MEDEITAGDGQRAATRRYDYVMEVARTLYGLHGDAAHAKIRECHPEMVPGLSGLPFNAPSCTRCDLDDANPADPRWECYSCGEKRSKGDIPHEERKQWEE